MQSTVDDYASLHAASLEQRRKNYQSLVVQSYGLATDFYEFGWGTSFHFEPRRRGESFKASLLRHQHFLADQMSLKPGMKVLDVGCGVGGPMENLARYCGASFVGLNNNAYQIKRARQRINRQDVNSRCSFIECDFIQIPEKDESYDAAFAIESMPHAPDKKAAFEEIWRILRPGALFGVYDWCITEVFDPLNEDHQKIKKDIEIGNGLPDIALMSDVNTALAEAGFEMIDYRDLAAESDPGLPWYCALDGRDFSLKSIARTPIGRAVTNFTLRVGEAIRLCPPGTRQVSTFLNAGADSLVRGGETGVFTPMYYILARKPAISGD